MAERAPFSPLVGTGWLTGWRLTFGGESLGWDGAMATVVEDAGHHTYTVLYEVDGADEHLLNRWEGADTGVYTKRRVRVETLEGPEVAWLYVLDDYEGGLPSARYVGLIADAAEKAGAPNDYVRQLRERPCRSTGV